jgi:hypothetical protein
MAVTEQSRRKPHIYCRPCGLDFPDHDALFAHVQERHPVTEGEEQALSINDDGTDLGPEDPAVESRGGEDPDWDNARPGQPLPEKPLHVVRDGTPESYTGRHRRLEPYTGRHRRPEPGGEG